MLLPEAEPERALQTLVDLDRDKKLLSRDIADVDLRLPDRVTVRLSDARRRRRATRGGSRRPKKAKKKKGGRGMTVLRFGLTPR